ncbi:MAG: hypothetical protein IVW56_04625 [Candidatus Binataceae bacterium]|nr:hypothetical protein [Candidatus Binataceae bacterium]
MAAPPQRAFAFAHPPSSSPPPAAVPTRPTAYQDELPFGRARDERRGDLEAQLAAIRGHKAQRAFLASLARDGDLTLFRGAAGFLRMRRLPDDLAHEVARELAGIAATAERAVRANPPPCPVCRLPMASRGGGLAACVFAGDPRMHELAAIVVATGDANPRKFARLRSSDRGRVFLRALDRASEAVRGLVAVSGRLADRADVHLDPRMRTAAVAMRRLHVALMRDVLALQRLVERP